MALPDIAGKIAYSNISSTQRYSQWFEKWVGDRYKDPFYPSGNGYKVSGRDCYALRCAFLHEGSEEISNQRVSDYIARFQFLATKNKNAHLNILNRTVQLDLKIFCTDICDGIETWLDQEKPSIPFSQSLNILAPRDDERIVISAEDMRIVGSDGRVRWGPVFQDVNSSIDDTERDTLDALAEDIKRAMIRRGIGLVTPFEPPAGIKIINGNNAISGLRFAIADEIWRREGMRELNIEDDHHLDINSMTSEDKINFLIQDIAEILQKCKLSGMEAMNEDAVLGFVNNEKSERFTLANWHFIWQDSTDKSD